jgi:hypothetical protein
MTLQLIVEGKGEIAAARQLVERLMGQAGVFDFRIARPIRQPSSQLIRQEGISKAVELALITEDVAAILILFDGDLDVPRGEGVVSPFCPKTDVPQLLRSAQEAARGVPCQIVVAYKEYESWLLAGIEGIRGKHGVPDDATCPNNFEAIRDAKGELASAMGTGRKYLPLLHQVSMTAHFHLGLAFRRSRSFRKLVKAFAELHDAAGHPLEIWTPDAW